MKRWLRWILPLLGLLVVFVIALPSLIAQRSVREWIIHELLEREGVSAQIDGIKLGWISPTEVTGLSLSPVDRPELLRIERVRSDRTFWTGLWEGIDVGNLTIDRPQVHLWFQNQQSNLEFPLAHSQTDHREEPFKESELLLAVNQAELWIQTDTMPKEVLILRGLDLCGSLRKGPNGRSFSLPSGRILDHAPVSPDLCAGGLKYIVPVLSEATWTKGEISLDVITCEIDLDEPKNSSVSGRLHIHGIEAGIKNQLIAAAGKRIASLLGRDGVDRIHLAENSTIHFEIRDEQVWHQGVEFGLPRVDPNLVVRSSGSVSFDEQLDLTIEFPIPLDRFADGSIARAITDNSLTIHAGGTFEDPKISFADGDLLSSVLSNLAGEEKPLQGILRGIQQSFRDRARQADGEEEETRPPSTRFLDRIRELRENNDGPLQRLRRSGEE